VSRSGDVTGELITTRTIRARSAATVPPSTTAATAAAASTDTVTPPPSTTSSTTTPSAVTPATTTATTTTTSGISAWHLPIGEQEMVLTLTNQATTATRYFARLSSSVKPAVRMSREEEVVFGDDEAAKMQSEILAELTRK
jgi:hypothetical protein